MQDKVIVITGASEGIGAALARLVGSQGAIPVLAARRAAELEAVAAQSSPRALAVITDVTRRAEVEQLARRAIEAHGHIDAWVNNAGRGLTRLPSQITDEDIDEMVTVNIKSVLYGIQAVLPHFQARRRGHIINISSLLGRVPLAAMRSAYGAAKHFVNGLTGSLRMELRAEYPDIHVSLVSPGVVATGFGLNARGGGVDSRAIPGAQPVEEVAQAIADCIARPRADVYTRPGYHKQVADYFAAEDLGAYEAAMAAATLGGPPRKGS